LFVVDQKVPTVRVPCYLSLAKQAPNSSMNVWGSVARHVVLNEMSEADVEKKKVEDKQREFIANLKKEEKEFEPEYFFYDEEEQFWKVRDLEWYKPFIPLVDEEEEAVAASGEGGKKEKKKGKKKGVKKSGGKKGEKKEKKDKKEGGESV
jgi:hypothetical protein